METWEKDRTDSQEAKLTLTSRTDTERNLTQRESVTRTFTQETGKRRGLRFRSYVNKL